MLLLIIAAGMWALVLGVDGIVFWGAVLCGLGWLLDRRIPGVDEPEPPDGP